MPHTDPAGFMWLDYLTLALYLVVVVGVGTWSSLKSSSNVSGYFFGGRKAHFIPVGASLFASNIGSSHFIGLAGSAADDGIAVAGYELIAIYILVLLGWLFAPVYLASGTCTLPDYMSKRFGGSRIRVFLSVIALTLSIFSKITVDLWAGSIFLKRAFDFSIFACMSVLIVSAFLFTMVGGLSAVIWTDTIQVALMLLGGVSLMIITFNKVGGHDELLIQYASALSQDYHASNGSCGGGIDVQYMSLLRRMDSSYPWPGMTFGLAVSSVWYWCSDQVIVQRVMAAKNLSHAKAGCLVCGYLKLTPLFMLVFPGMAARVLFPDQVACSTPDACQAFCGRDHCSNYSYPELVMRLMPAGGRGLMVAVVLSALLSSLTSVFNSSSTLFAIDLWPRWRPHATELELVVTGKLFVFLMLIVCFVWLPVLEHRRENQLFEYLQAVTSFLSPPVCAVFLLSVFVSRCTEPGVFYGLVVGSLVGVARFLLQFLVSKPRPCEPDLRPPWYQLMVVNMHFLIFGLFLFLYTVCITLIISFCTEPLERKYFPRLTFWTRHSAAKRGNIDEDKLGVPPMLEEREGPRPATLPTVVYRLLGISTATAMVKSEAATYALAHQDTGQLLERICDEQAIADAIDANMIVLLAVASFIYGFYL